MLLEETLATNASSNPLSPTDAALALLSFLRDELPAGGIASENRFVKLFPLIVDRAFGRWSVSAPPLPSSTTPHQTDGGCIHNDDGWFSMTNSPVQQNQKSPEFDPIVRLLRAPRSFPRGDSGQVNSYAPTLLDALSAETARHPGVHVNFPLSGLLLPNLIEDWKECFVHELSRVINTHGATTSFHGNSSRFGCVSIIGDGDETKPGVVGKENATRLLYHVLNAGPDKQLALRSHFQKIIQQRGASVHQPSSPFGKTFGGSPRSSPTHVGSPPMKQLATTARKANVDDKSNAANIELTMLEYYLLIFVRFPLANSTWQQKRSSQPSRIQSSRPYEPAHYGQRIYSYLFSTYIEFYLPHGSHANSNIVNEYSGIEKHSITPVSSSFGLDRTSELFISLVIEFWLEFNVAPTTNDAVARYRRARGSSVDDTGKIPTLKDSLELAQPTKSQFQAPPPQVRIGVIAIVRHLLSDIALRNLNSYASNLCQRLQSSGREGTNENSESISGSKLYWCLTPAMTAIQCPLFNHIRLGLACGDIHVPNSSFHKALEVWLTWLEPWCFVLKRVKTTHVNASINLPEVLRSAAASITHQSVEYYPSYVQPNYDSPSTFSPQWASYIPANIHFYTVPLAIFLKRARELEFSSSVQYTRSLALVQRVLRVYSKPVVDIVKSSLNEEADVISMGILSKFNDIMGPFKPTYDVRLSSCQFDAIDLLEEIFGQYQKRCDRMPFFERWESRIDSFLSGSLMSDVAKLQSTLSQVRYLVDLPFDYQVLPEMIPKQANWSGFLARFFSGKVKTIDKERDNSGPERDLDGIITDKGRWQLSTGRRKCSPFDAIRYIGDPMLKPYQSYENPALVDLSIIMSNFLNQKLELSEHTRSREGDQTGDPFTRNLDEMVRYNKIRFRVNLRFLADYRNIVWLSVAIWVVRKLV